MTPPAPRRRYTRAPIAFYRDVRARGLPGSVDYVADNLRDALADRFGVAEADAGEWPDAPIGFHHGYPLAAAANLAPHPIKIGSFVREGRAPAAWGVAIAGLDLVVVPSKWSRDLLRAVAPEARILVVHHGIDPAFVPDPRPPRPDDGIFRVYSAHAQSSDPWRKGEDLVVAAFARAFAGDSTVRLVLNTGLSSALARAIRTAGIEEQIDHDPIWNRPAADVAAAMRRCDVGLFLPRAEAFGLLPLEAAAAGLPLVVPRSTGLCEYLDGCLYCSVETTPRPADRSWSDGGEVPEPGIESAAAALRVARMRIGGLRADARERAAAIGRRFAWAQVTVPLLDAVDELVRSDRARAHRPRLRIALASTADGTKCGIATYTENLARALAADADVRIFAEGETIVWTGGPDDRALEAELAWNRGDSASVLALADRLAAWGPDVVHLQHEFGIWRDDGAFVGLLQSLAARSVPVVVTLHTVHAPRTTRGAFYRAMRWPDAVVVHSDAAAAALGEWNRRASVVTISHGTRPDVPLDRVAARAQLGLPAGGVVALTLGYVTPDKAVEETVEAVLDLRGADRLPPGFRYILAGAGHAAVGVRHNPALAAVRDLVARRDLDGRTIDVRSEHVPAADLPAWFGAADFAILNRRPLRVFSTSGAAHLTLGFGVPAVWRECALHDTLRETGWPFYSIAGLRHEITLAARAAAENRINNAGVMQRRSATFWSTVAARHLDLYREVA